MPIFKWSKVAASNGNSDSTINWSEGQSPSSVNDSARAEMAAVAKWRDDISGTITTGGSSTVYTVTTNSVFDSLANMDGAIISFVPHTTNGASPTLNVDGLGAKQIRSATGVNIPTGALISGTPYQVVYKNGATEFILLNYRDTFLNASVTGTLTMTGQILAADGSNAAPSYSFASDADNGLYLIGANNPGIAAGGTKVIDIATTGISITGTLSASSDVAINTNKFNITGASGNTTIAGTLGVTGNIAVNTNKLNVTAASGNVASAGSVLSSSASGGIGYATGAGGAVTQATSKSTSVTLNAICGQVTMNGAALGAGSVASFFITNSAAVSGDVVAINHFNIGSAGSYTVNARTSTNGRIDVDVRNNTAGSLSEAIILSFALIKAVTS